MSQIIKVGNGTLGAGEDNEVGIAEFETLGDIVHLAAFLFQRVEVVIIGNVGQANDNDVQSGYISICLSLVEIDGVLLGDADIVEIGQDAQQGQAGALFQEIHGGLEEGDLAAKLFDNQPP